MDQPNVPNMPKCRPSRACEVCHEKKIRCDLVGEHPCTHCRTNGVTCRPHQRQRKRKRSIPPPSAPRVARGASASRYDAGDLHGGQISHLTNHQNDLPSTSQMQGAEGPSNLAPAPEVEPESSANSPVPEGQDGLEKETPGSQGYLGRSEYLGLAAPQPNEISSVQDTGSCVRLTEEERAVLDIYRAFELPPLAVQRSLIDSFEMYCAPWMPILETRHLQNPSSLSILLLQSVFVAGSRVAAAAHISASSETYYRRAKALFFSNYEPNPVIKIAAACLLNWWNPLGPDKVSLDGSGFWLRVAVSLAYQIGLHKESTNGKNPSYRRRLWWTLVARDSQMSAAHGRPRAISLADSDVALPSPHDFVNVHHDGALFSAYVNISLILGDVTETYLRHQITVPKQRNFRHALYCWVNELPSNLRLFSQSHNGQLNPYNLRTRSLHVPYFVILTFLYRSASPPDVPITIAAVASSFLAGIFEEFLARDEFRFQAPVFKFYAFAAGMAQAHARAFLSTPSETLTEESEIVNTSLIALAVRWSSANDNLRILQNANKKMTVHQQKPSLSPLSSSHEAHSLFSALGPDLCRLWHLIQPNSSSSNTQIAMKADMQWASSGAGAVSQALCRVSGDLPPSVSSPGLQLGQGISSSDIYGSISLIEQAGAIGTTEDENSLWSLPIIESSGSWLLGQMPGVLFDEPL
ncbi:uncharacterized protein N7515_003061 [Penicillium bovifimosum]|uniref:Zn(2)-C6 fungal-type domain-containing protein n=1 Tax=Penicillium bovifimosum TaxID=126998 RepID=A0A9W9H454_9EURO|nr:uncharacterized protein N7515_003061 [Penicillium bovifimosum]KAJ5138213.1 hypothetical protein N7515_003061 [Penicillium bovifimosum]